MYTSRVAREFKLEMKIENDEGLFDIFYTSTFIDFTQQAYTVASHFSQKTTFPTPDWR